MRIAVIADIHSNAPALDAVLDDIARRSVDQIVQLGDAFNGPIDPVGVATRLQMRPMVHLRGNGERMVLSEDPKQRSRSAQFARERLTPEVLDWIRTWPMVISHPEYYAFHATPHSDTDYLIEELVPRGVRLRDRDAIRFQLENVTSASLALCGHTHVPQYVRVSENLVVLNPGSVGLPAYSDISPIPHAMQTGSPEARYAVVDIEGTRITAAHICVQYDYKQAAALAVGAGFHDWNTALLTGYAE
jgi:predicted phosphodiesterase